MCVYNIHLTLFEMEEKKKKKFVGKRQITEEYKRELTKTKSMSSHILNL